MRSNSLCLDIKASSENCLELKKNMGSTVLEHAVKVRKPYTISKQRERWSEEEHNKFLEALKLYCRGWRQIEEHVGTKTAVQIRSHAQKFFTKVVRESAGDNSGEVKTVEIPPPRPKRKPRHPYPRKLGNSPDIPVMEKQKWSLMPKFLVSEQDNITITKLSPHEQDDLSPTSVLSEVVSDTFGSSSSDLVNSTTSPLSPAVGSDPVGASLSEPENGCQSVTTSVEDITSLSQHGTDMELDLGIDCSIPCKEACSKEAPAASLKLFGKTVVVADPQKSLCSTFEDAEQSHEPFVATNLKSHFGNLGEGRSQWNSWSNGAIPMFYLLPSHVNSASGAVPMPRMWAFCGGAEPPTDTPQSMNSERDQLPSCGESSDDGGVEKEGSFTDSNTASIIETSIEESSTIPGLKFRPSERSAFRSLKATSNKPSKGFVPYRRCVPEKEVDNQEMVRDDGDVQGEQLFL